MINRIQKTAVLVIMALAAFAMPAGVHAQRGEKCFGVSTGYTSTNESAIGSLFLQYGLTDNLRISPEVGCVFRHHDLDAFTLDLNLHFPLTISSSRLQLYPLAGLNFSSWTLHNLLMDDTDDVSTRTSNLGANLGAGFQLFASSSLKLKIEAKYTLISHHSTFVCSVGIGYVF